MFCSKCGKKILDGDVFCPGCGTKIEWARFIEPEPFEEKIAEPEIPSVKEKFDFNWDLDDFTRKKNEDVKIEWGDLLGIEEKKEATEQKEEIIESPFADLNKKEEPEPVKEAEPAMEEGLDFFQREEKFDTFNRKNQEFQELLDKERDRVRKNAEANAMMAEEIDSWAEKKEVELEESETVPEEIEIPDVIGEPEPVIEEVEEVPETEEIPEIAEEPEEIPEPVEEEPEPEVEEEVPAEEEAPEEEPEKEPEEPEVIPAVAPVPEEKLSFFERRRRKREQKQAMYEAPAAPAEPEEPLKMDEDDIGGEWTEPEEKAEAPEVPEINITKVEEPEDNIIEDMLAEDTAVAPERKKSMTQKISRDEFSDFLKSIEAQFGIDEMDAAVAETELVAEEPAAEAEEILEIIEEPEEEAAPEEIEEAVEEPAAEAEEIPESIEVALSEITEEAEEVPEAEEIAEEPEEEVPVEAEPEPEAETVAVEDITEIEPEASAKKKEDTGEFKLGDFKDDSFWDDEQKSSGAASESSKKGSGFGTFLIVLLAIILLAEIAILVIRFQFPDTAIAQTIEPVLTQIEQWIRGLFT